MSEWSWKLIVLIICGPAIWWLFWRRLMWLGRGERDSPHVRARLLVHSHLAGAVLALLPLSVFSYLQSLHGVDFFAETGSAVVFYILTAEILSMGVGVLLLIRGGR